MMMNEKKIDIFWKDLTAEKQKEIARVPGGKTNIIINIFLKDLTAEKQKEIKKLFREDAEIRKGIEEVIGKSHDWDSTPLLIMDFSLQG